jgi:hypothetical protein
VTNARFFEIELALDAPPRLVGDAILLSRGGDRFTLGVDQSQLEYANGGRLGSN